MWRKLDLVCAEEIAQLQARCLEKEFYADAPLNAVAAYSGSRGVFLQAAAARAEPPCLSEQWSKLLRLSAAGGVVDLVGSGEPCHFDPARYPDTVRCMLQGAFRAYTKEYSGSPIFSVLFALLHDKTCYLLMERRPARPPASSRTGRATPRFVTSCEGLLGLNRSNTRKTWCLTPESRARAG